MGVNNPVWDNVPVLASSLANPAAGSNPAEQTVAAGKRVLILGATVSMVTDATVANRYANFVIKDDGTNVSRRYGSSTAQTATQTRTTTFMAGLAASYSDGAVIHVPFPAAGVEIVAGGKWQITWTSIQAGDDAAVVYFAYKELPTG